MSRTVFLPQRIKEARLDRKLSQESLASLINTSRQNVLRWENGQHEPGPASIAAIARETGKPLDFFFGDDDDEEAALRRIVDQFCGLLVSKISEVARAREAA